MIDLDLDFVYLFQLYDALVVFFNNVNTCVGYTNIMRLYISHRSLEMPFHQMAQDYKIYI